MCNTRSALKAFLYLPRMKSDILLLTSIIFLGLQAGAYAQAPSGAVFNVTSIPVTVVSDTNNTAPAGDIVFTQLGGTSEIGELAITYPVPITCDLFTGPITVTGTGGYDDGSAWFDSESSQNYDALGHGILVIHVPGGSVGGSITVSGVRLAVADSGLSSISAHISSDENNAIVAGQTSITVINSVQPGIASISGIAGEIDANTGEVTASPWVGATEGYWWAFDWQDPQDTTRVLVRFTLDSAPPSGITVTFPAQAVASSSSSSSVWVTTNSYGKILDNAIDITSSSTDLSVYYRTNTTVGDPSFFYRETLSVPVTLSVDEGSSLSAGTVSYTVSLAPVGPAFDDGSVILDPIPRFQGGY
jgi:hypothetical protein